jgi:predicted alpha-1,2-mannosidase
MFFYRYDKLDWLINYSHETVSFLLKKSDCFLYLVGMYKKNGLLIIIFLISISLGIESCEHKRDPANLAASEKALTRYVNPFIGTGGHGHTYPGATMPFGMMQLSPDTRLDGWDGCSGYHYTDNHIYGFSHTHLSGTGVSDYGDVLLMPTNQPVLNNGADGEQGYRSKFSHEKETANPGYYDVHLQDTDIDVRLTVTKRAGIHEYTFPSSSDQYVILDLEHRDELLEHDLTFISDQEISGKRYSKAWASKQMLYFYIKTSHPMIGWNIKREMPPSKTALQFDNPNNEPVTLKIGISPVDEKGAQNNLVNEIGSRTFEDVQRQAQEIWELELNKIVIEDDNYDHKVNFYTAMYHTMIAPNLYQDVDGRYRGMDLKIHQTTDFDYYTVFSLWDTYRATHPLYTIIDQKRTNDFINTFNAKYDEGGILPIWDLSGNYTGCMIGYHAVPVIADAYLKGIRDYNVEKAFDAMKHSASQDKLGLKSYKELGFIPVELESESVSKTLEYAFDDWTIAQMAQQLGKEEDFATYTKRAQYYKNLFNPATHFFQGRIRNSWFTPFKPDEVNFNYTEANAWQYSMYAPQDISGHLQLMGGPVNYEQHLDDLFSAAASTSGRHQVDITGLIGQYAHGNEPSHHMAYLYNFVGKPYKTQEKVYEILTTLYKNTADGISGNEDCGQMSAWYIFSSLGFYPVTPGSNQYIIGAPLFDQATLHLENGNVFKVIKKGTGRYVKEVHYAVAKAEQQQSITTSYLDHGTIMDGGVLTFTMNDQPTSWGGTEKDWPKTAITKHLIVSPPFIKSGDIAFPKESSIELATIDTASSIYYSIDGGKFEKYTTPIRVKTSARINTFAQMNLKKSATISTQLYKYDDQLRVIMNHTYANEYSAGGTNAVIDGMKGTIDFRCGSWQGTQNENLDFVIDLGTSKQVREIRTQFLKDQRSWIFYPKNIEVSLLDKDRKTVEHKNITLPDTGEEEISAIHSINIPFSSKKLVQFVHVKAVTAGALPEWHLGHEHKGTAWTFIDEITID